MVNICKAFGQRKLRDEIIHNIFFCSLVVKNVFISRKKPHYHCVSFVFLCQAQGDTVHIIYCYHVDDPLDNIDIQLHNVRGSYTVNLFGQLHQKPALSNDTQFLDVRNNQVTLLHVLWIWRSFHLSVGEYSTEQNNIYLHCHWDSSVYSQSNTLCGSG